MTWTEIRQLYPNCWVVVEALGAYTQDDKRIITDFRLVQAFNDDWHVAWECYKRVHHADKWREYYPLHTTNEVLNIGVIYGPNIIWSPTSPNAETK